MRRRSSEGIPVKKKVLYSTVTLATRLGVTKRNIDFWCARGLIKFKKSGKRRVFHVRDIEKFEKERGLK